MSQNCWHGTVPICNLIDTKLDVFNTDDTSAVSSELIDLSESFSPSKRYKLFTLFAKFFWNEDSVNIHCESLIRFRFKMLEFCWNSAKNLILTIVVEFSLSTISALYSPVMLGKKITIKLLNRISTTMVKTRFSAEFWQNSSILT